MITEDYVNFEIAKLLEEKGFDETCYACYEYFSSSITMYSGYSFEYKGEPVHSSKNIIKCPTLQMAMKWLREEKNIIIYVYPIINLPVKDNYTFYWRWDGKKKRHDAPSIGDKHNYESFEQAVEAGLKYSLENLI